MKPPLDRATQANQYRAHPCCVLPCRQWLLGIRPQILVCRISSATACICYCAGHTRRRCGAASLPSIDNAVGVGASLQLKDDLPVLLQSANRYGQR